MEGAWVQSLAMELDPTRGTQDLVQPHLKKKKNGMIFPKKWERILVCVCWEGRGGIRDLLKVPKERQEDH